MRITAIVLMLTFLAGCSMFGHERSQLPEGVTLLKTLHGECDGTVMFENDIDVGEGQSTVIKVDDYNDIDWTCTGRPRGGDAFRCPAGTDYIRVIRESRRREFTVECFG